MSDSDSDGSDQEGLLEEEAEGDVGDVGDGGDDEQALAEDHELRGYGVFQRTFSISTCNDKGQLTQRGDAQSYAFKIGMNSKSEIGCDFTLKMTNGKTKTLKVEATFLLLDRDLVFEVFLLAKRLLVAADGRDALGDAFTAALDALRQIADIPTDQAQLERYHEAWDDYFSNCTGNASAKAARTFMLSHLSDLPNLERSTSLHKDMKQCLTRFLQERFPDLPHPEARAAISSDCSHIFARAALLTEPSTVAPRNRIFLEREANRALSDCGDHIMIALAGRKAASHAFQQLRNSYMRRLQPCRQTDAEESDFNIDDDLDLQAFFQADVEKSELNTNDDLEFALQRGRMELALAGVSVNDEGFVLPTSPAFSDGFLRVSPLGELLGLGKLLRSRLFYRASTTRANRVRDMEGRLLRSALAHHYHLSMEIQRLLPDPTLLVSEEDLKFLATTPVLPFKFRHGTVDVAAFDVNDALFSHVLMKLSSTNDFTFADLCNLELRFYDDAKSIRAGGRLPQQFPRLDVQASAWRNREKKMTVVRYNRRFYDVLYSFGSQFFEVPFIEQLAKACDNKPPEAPALIKQYKQAVGTLKAELEDRRTQGGPQAIRAARKAAGLLQAIKRKLQDLLVPCLVEICLNGKYLDLSGQQEGRITFPAVPIIVDLTEDNEDDNEQQPNPSPWKRPHNQIKEGNDVSEVNKAPRC